MKKYCLFLSLFFASLAFADVKQSNEKKYAIIFEIFINSKKIMTTCKVGKVIDPATGKTDAIEYKVSKKYIENVCLLLSKKKEPYYKDGKIAPFYTYYFLNPEDPDKVITELK